MKRTTTTRPNGFGGATRTSTSTSSQPPQKKSRTAGERHETSKGTSEEKEKDKEAAFMASLLADLDDDFWNAAPTSSPQASPVKKRSAGVVGNNVSTASSSTSSASVNETTRISTINAPGKSTPVLVRAPTTPVKNGNTNKKLPSHSHHPSSKSNEPKRSASTSTSISDLPFAPSSSSSPLSNSLSSLSTSTSALSSSADPNLKSTSASSSKGTSALAPTPTGFDLQSFLQGSEDWDLGDGALSPVKPVVKPAIQPQPSRQSQFVKRTVVPHTRGLSHAPGADARKTESKKEVTRYTDGKGAYTPDPCTRCVVLSVEDISVDGVEGGQGRKKWEKHIKALAHVPNTTETSQRSEEEKKKEKVEVEVVLCDGWYETDVRVDDVFNIIGHFTPRLTCPATSTLTPTIRLTFTSTTSNHDNNTNNNLLILHPDVLLTATALSSAAQCARKPVLSSLVRQSASGVVGGEGDNKASPAMVYGNILHEVLDRCLVADRWGIDLKENHKESKSSEGVNEQWMNKCIDEAIRGSLGELVRLGLEEGDVRREIRERARGFGLFAQRYLGRTPKEDGILNNTRTLARDAPSKLAITHLLDIEEDIWSPAYGIKGKIDAVVRGIIDDPVPVQQPLYNSGLKRSGYSNTFDTTTTTTRTTVTRMQRHTPLPLELKTGRVQTGMDHRAQTMLYTLLLSERYNVDVRDGLLFYSRLRETEDGNNHSANGKLVGEDMVRVPRGWNEIRGLIGLRNRLAGFIWRRIRKTKDGGAEDHDVPNRQEDFHIEKERDIEEEEEEDFLPPPVDDEWACKRCYALDTCLLFRKTHPPLSLPPTQNQKPIPAIPPPGRLRQLFDAHTAHLTPARVAFFKKWEALLALEERDMVRFKRELWVLGAQEREKRGRCLGGMRVTAIGPGASDDAGNTQTQVQDEDGDGDGEEGKWGKEGKIYRFVYTLEKDLDFLLENGDGKDEGKGSAADYNLSLQNTHLVKGDPITISLMGPRQVLALARGYILDFQVAASSPDRSDLSSFDPDSDSNSSDVEVAEDEDEDANMLFNLGMHVGNESDDESEVSKQARKTERGRERRLKRMNRSPRGRIIIGVDHSLHPWLSGNVGGGTPLGVNLGGRHGHRTQSTYQQRRSTMTPQDQGGVGNKAIFRIDKDELFGGMSRVRENLASLFYASGPVSVPPTNENAGQTTTTMGRGNKKLLELVVDLRAPQFDDGASDDMEVEIEIEQEEVGINVHTAEARYFDATRGSPTPASPTLNAKEKAHQNTQNQEQQQQPTQHLNPAQSLAIHRALSARDYALILGMPGTGKTCVIAALVKELVFGSSHSHPSTSTSASKPISRRRPKTVLISSYTHSAVDSILRKLVEGGRWDMDMKRKGRIVRLGNVEKIHPEVRKFSPTFSKGDEREMTVEELEEIYMNASVVATTCLGLDHPLFSRRRFDYCILDEASQITLPTCLGPLRFADVFVLVGDHHQLPPLVKNPLARPPIPVDSKSPLTIEALTSTPSLTTSLFLLLSTAHPESVVELTEQYRMNEDIMTISNELVYGGRMTCGVGAGVMGLNGVVDDEEDFLRSLHRASSTLLPEEEGEEEGEDFTMYKQCRGAQGGDECWLERLCDDRTKAIFINTDALTSARESRVGDLVQNLGEAQLVAQFVETLRRKGVHGSRVGVVTLYRQQVKVLEGLLNGVDHKVDVVEIMTADKSQGRDKDCVVVSLVRSNEAGRIGDLVKDWRRINVSFTRARCKLVIFGSRQTLEREPMLSRFFELMDRKGWVLNLKEGAERAHAHAWSLPMAIASVRLDVDRDVPVAGFGGMKRSRTEDEEDNKGMSDPHRRTKENSPATSSASSWDGDKKLGVDSTRPVKRIRSEDKPDALLKGRPVLRDLVGNEMCL